jgi:hypothetical protein
LPLLTLARQDIYISWLQHSRVLGLCLPLVLAIGCAQQKVGLLPIEDASRQLPFDRIPDGEGVRATAALAPGTVPAGTSLVIRLQSPISSVGAHAGDLFQGVLDQPVLLKDRTLLPIGTSVRGKVLAVKPGGLEEPGYLRLTLASILLDDKTLDLHTSSLFAKAGSHPRSRPGIEDASSATLTDVAAPEKTVSGYPQTDVKFSTARRLTFRLVRPLALPD